MLFFIIFMVLFPTVMKYCYFVLFLFLSLSLFSQTKSRLVTGYIIDAISKEKKSNINIVATKNNQGTTSDEKGYFEMILPISHDTLHFSLVGFHSKTVCISGNQDTSIIVEMLPKVYKLKEVAITGENNTYNAQVNGFSILDYGFIGDSILILQRRRSSRGLPSLVLLDGDYDTIVYKNDLPKQSKMLFKDCLGTYHVIAKDSAYQISFDDDCISLYEPFHLAWFYQVLGDCIFKKEENLFFEWPICEGFGHQVIYVNERSKIRSLFVKYIDVEGLSSYGENIMDISNYYSLHGVPNGSTNDSATIHHIHFYSHFRRYFKEFQNEPLMNNICLFHDTIFYFNFHESKIQCFSDLVQPPAELPLNEDNTKGWKGEFVIDQIGGKIYSIEKNKTYYNIYTFDMENGEFDYCTRVSQFKGENLNINNGFVYYLTNPSTSSGSIAKLSRIKLKN